MTNLVALWVRQCGADGEVAFSARCRSLRLDAPELREVQPENSSSRSCWIRKTLRSLLSVAFKNNRTLKDRLEVVEK